MESEGIAKAIRIHHLNTMDIWFIYLPGTIHINQHFSLHVGLCVCKLANEQFFLMCSPWDGYKTSSYIVINTKPQQVLQNNTIQYITEVT